MTRTMISCFLLLSVSNALWPVPKTYHHGESVLWIAQDVLVSYSEPYGSSSFKLENVASVSGNSTPSIMVVQVAMEQIYRSLFFESFVPWKFHPRGASFEPTTQEERTYIHTIALKQLSPDTGNHLPSGNRPTDESYTLDVLLNGQVIVNAASSVGIAHALATLSQLFYTHSSGGSYMTNAPVHIQDHPTFAHRGLNLDVARNYYPAQDIKRTIDALAFNKMNRLHLHITDAQSWPLEIPSIPELAAHGAYHPGLTYSPQALEDLQRYGLLRGVETFIEIDMPGHTSSIWFSHPELIAAFNVQPNWMDYAGEPPSGTLKLNSSEVYDFLDRLFADLVPRVSPWTSYFHTGGDEVDFNTLLLDETVRSNEPDVLRPLLQKFFDHTRQNVHSRGMTQIVWEELLLEYNLTLPKDVVVQAWRSESSVASIVNKGHHVIAGNYEDWYLDCGHGTWVNYAPGELSISEYPYKDYCDPYKNWRLIYSYDPLLAVPANKHDLVLGAEVSIWSEQTDAVSLDTVIWPRVSAAAEVLWSGAKDPVTGQNRSQVEAAPRLSEMRERLVGKGVKAALIQMPFCTMNGTQCAQSM